MATHDKNAPVQNVAPVAIVRVEALQTSVQAFSAPLAHYLQDLGLPTDSVLAGMDERRFVINNLATCLEVLPYDERARAYYLTKFSVAVAVGLFDAALNFLWNESVGALRRKVAELDLQYFFDIAEKREKYRAELNTADDLVKIEELVLVDSCARMGLLSDLNRERLRHINYMRNHASAAHPNDAEINGAEMVSWLTNCLKYAITAEPDASVVQVNRLLQNVRTTAIPSTDIKIIAAEVIRLPQERVDDLLWTLFGLYTDTKATQECRENIGKLAPAVWGVVTEARRYSIGARHATFLKNADVARKDLSTEFLTKVDGLRYRSEDVLVVELLDKLRNLEQAHHGHNNFSNEWPHARALKDALPPSGIVPVAARREWTKVICQCWIGNGHGYRDGTDEAAVPSYEAYLAGFTESEVRDFLDLLADTGFTVDFGSPKAAGRARGLAGWLKGKTTNLHLHRALDMVSNASDAALRKVAGTTDFKNALASSLP